MEVREAVENDAERLAAIADTPTDAVRNIVHDRTVRVAVEPGGTGESGPVGESDSETASDPEDRSHAEGASGSDGEGEADEGEQLLGFVSFDAHREAVHVTQLSGTVEACERLLTEPIEFARAEGMPVEFLVPKDETEVMDVAEAAGFERSGQGPRFDGTPTVRYRLEP